MESGVLDNDINWKANPGPPTTRCSSSPRGGDGSRGDAEETRGDRERRSIYLNTLAFTLRGAFLFLSRPQTTHHFPKPAVPTRLLHSNFHHCSSLPHGRAHDVLLLISTECLTRKGMIRRAPDLDGMHIAVRYVEVPWRPSWLH